jgi:threonine dehydratase
MITLKDVEESYQRIRHLINKTPVMTSRTLDTLTNAKVFLKCENFQRTGSFKFRGVTNKVLQLTTEEKKKGVITHSSGNHAQAVALAASITGVKAVVVMPENAPLVKVEATRNYGAEIIRCGNTMESREQTCKELMDKHGYTLIHPYDDEEIIKGAGTAAYELIKEVGSLDYMICPIGGGGLTSGTAIATKGLLPDAKVIAVEPEKADDAYQSFKKHRLYPSLYPDTIADGLRTSLSRRTFNIITKNVDDIILVKEEEIVDAMRFLWSRMKLVVEPSGAVPVAGLFKMKKHINDKRIGVIITGGNLDLEWFFKRYYEKI